MKRAEPYIQREIHAAIVTFEIAVMKLVVEMTEQHTTASGKQHLVETCVAKDRRQRQHIAMEHHQNWIRRHDKMNQ